MKHTLFKIFQFVGGICLLLGFIGVFVVVGTIEGSDASASDPNHTLLKILIASFVMLIIACIASNLKED